MDWFPQGALSTPCVLPMLLGPLLKLWTAFELRKLVSRAKTRADENCLLGELARPVHQVWAMHHIVYFSMMHMAGCKHRAGTTRAQEPSAIS